MLKGSTLSRGGRAPGASFPVNSCHPRAADVTLGGIEGSPGMRQAERPCCQSQRGAWEGRATRGRGSPALAAPPFRNPSLIPTRAQTLLLNQTPHRPVPSLLEYPSLLWPLDTPLLPSSAQDHFPEVWTLSCLDPWRGRGWREGLGTILLLCQPRGMLGSSTAKWKSKPTNSRPQIFEALPRC